MEYQGICDVGLQRKMNQDAVYMEADEETGLFCVADGMGGHSHGERASKEVVSALSHWWHEFRGSAYNGDFAPAFYSLQKTLVAASETIFHMSMEGEICGTTAVVLFIFRGQYGILNAGDSRVYLCSGYRVRSLTVDEVWENQPGNTLDAEEKRKHPNFGKLVNALGIAEQARISGSTDIVRPGMIFLLCSDGLYKMCSNRVIVRALRKCKRGLLDEIISRLIAQVYKGGAKDNVSIILVKA